MFKYYRGRWITLLSCSFYLLISSQSLVNTAFPAFIHVSLKSYSTSKGTQHDIVSISRCLHLEHLLLFYFFIFVFLYCTKCIYKSFKSFSLNLHTVSVPQQIFCIWIFAYQFMKLSFSNTKICRRFINR